MESFCKAKDTVSRTKQQITEWERSSSHPHPLEHWYARNIKKVLKKLEREVSNGQVELTEMFNIPSHWKIQIKMTMRFHLRPVKMARIKKHR